jgi:peptidoglycan/LPS O-acetylase OafA/YrhL
MQLDLLRAIAILLVLGSHCPSPPDSGFLHPLDALMHRIGWSGVDLFFVLSGYLIGGLLFNEIKRWGELDVRRFLVRRMLRIWPSYYLLLLFVVVRVAWQPGSGLGSAWAHNWMGFVHIQNFIWTSRDHLWSLAVEEHFYLALPLFLWWAVRRHRDSSGISIIPRVCLALSIGCLLLRTLLHFTTTLDVRMQSYLCIDALFFGVNLAYLNAYRPGLLPAIARRAPALLLIAGLVYLPCAVSDGHLRRTIGYTGVYLAAAALLVVVVNLRPGQGRLAAVLYSRPARWLALMGTHSYSIYLWHRDFGWDGYQVAARVAERCHLPGPLAWVLYTITYFTASIATGILLGKLIEVPVQRLREHLFPPRASANPTPALAA